VQREDIVTVQDIHSVKEGQLNHDTVMVMISTKMMFSRTLGDGICYTVLHGATKEDDCVLV